jgi:hypothetical protein
VNGYGGMDAEFESVFPEIVLQVETAGGEVTVGTLEDVAVPGGKTPVCFGGVGHIAQKVYVWVYGVSLGDLWFLYVSLCTPPKCVLSPTVIYCPTDTYEACGITMQRAGLSCYMINLFC